MIKPFFFKLKPFKKTSFFENQELTACFNNKIHIFPQSYYLFILIRNSYLAS